MNICISSPRWAPARNRCRRSWVVTPDEIEAVKKKFGLNVNGRTIFGLNPGAEYGPAKRWPVGKFIFARNRFKQHTSCTWILFGSQADVAIASRIESAISGPPSAIWNLAGKTGLRELMALLKTLPRAAHQ